MRDNPTYDFGAIATKYNVKCADGRTIRNDAFKDMDGKTVPLIWNHDHENPYSVIGHALLESRDDGMYSYLSFNDSDLGKHCKSLVEHGDVKGVSIYANKLKQSGKDVLHGVIRELSLVLAGANPEAYINTVLAHGEDTEEAGIFDYCEGFLAHSDEESEEEPKDTNEPENQESEDSSENEETEMKEELNNEEMQHSGIDETLDIEKEYNSMTEKQKAACNALVMMATEEGEDDMAHNIFEGNDGNDIALAHSAMSEIFKDSKRFGSLKESFIQHADDVEQYGIDHMEYFQKPEGTDIYDRPQFITNVPDGWVDIVLNGVHETPFSKVRMMFADITEDEARAKGYIKGNYKKEEFFKLIKRTVEPTTIYKKQKFDRDDLADADWDIIPWIKDEMNLKLKEEEARAIIFGDGRSNGSEDKIDENKVIPVISDDELFVISQVVTPETGESLEHAIITASNLSLDDYTGSGSITCFMENRRITKMMLLEDQFGHRLYKTRDELANAMGYSRIVPVPKGMMPADTYSVALDLRDYNIGRKNMGKKTWYSDFDIDYNQMKYLLEGRMSGALIRPKSAIVLKADNG